MVGYNGGDLKRLEVLINTSTEETKVPVLSETPAVWT
jgi:hypothetical protein